MATLGFIGLGIMGSAMARNLLRAGHELRVWNRTRERCGSLVAAGAVACDTPQAVVTACPFTFAMVSDPEAARAVAWGPRGVVAGMGPGRAYIDCSTVDPDTATEISAAVTARGGRFLEAPVSGSRKPAEDGTLVVLTAGEESLYREALPYLEVLGKKAFYLGAVGRGATLKLIVNLVMGEMMAALCEGISLAERAHIPTDVLLDVLDAGAVANPMFRLKGPAIHQREFAVNFPLKHMQKDLRLALELGDRLALALPAGAAVNELFKRARDLGLGDLDFAALFRACAGE